ncbi:putative GPI transamidase component Tta2 [Trypanosoma rangeli]|uniref:Putative GPI transamidase component Tta2 n=1 Tax=Trypanosoma rangeli TaxID=5698 RepID=A0A422P255_TRYRA|nr:putative GPI transamidase component Tta2 [Trypanosoma rangeli]RNF11823.1 putative GPI transamidase component Tta2 [Trypanosoma rangeli]|eukprot:RNF11823.1 putative GPI transamidase component Tta2 [Trypanosoma rangeli]
MLRKKSLTLPLMAALVTLTVRLLTYMLKEHLSLPYHFGITTPNTGAETWKEAVFWKHQFGVVPDYLVAVVPWYVEYIPLLPSAVNVSILCVCDAVTVFLVSQWPSAVPQLVFTLFVLNPAMVLLPALESLAPLEHLILTVIIECCRRRRSQGWLIYVARILAPVLGLYFIALTVALWFPVGTSSSRSALVGVLLSELIVGGFGLFYLVSWGSVSARTSLYSPPDNGVMWYVRLLIIPVFGQCMEIFQLQLPAFVTLLVAVALPSKVPAKTLAYANSVPGDRRLLVVLFAVCVSKLCRCHLALPDYSLGVFFIYSLLDTTGRNGKGGKEESRQSMFDCIRSANVFVPVYTLLLVVPLQYSFYTGWVMWDTANPNWVFFPQVAFVVVGAIFMLTFLRKAFGVINAETVAGDKPKQS